MLKNNYDVFPDGTTAVHINSPRHGYHRFGELADAAVCYAANPNRIGITDDCWPWAEGSWKPTPGDRIKELVKAGQFIAAEIDRLQRAERGETA